MKWIVGTIAIVLALALLIGAFTVLAENTKTTAYAETVPLAICRAALKAVSNE